VENDRGGDEIVVSKPLLLLIRIVFRDDALASKSKPFGVWQRFVTNRAISPQVI
jgi:hypothetical protein